jgi:cytochrome P450
LGEFPAITAEEPGQAHKRWMREYRNPTGLVSYPGLFYVRRVMPTSSATVQHILNNWTLYIKPEQSRRALSRILGDGLLTAEGEMHRRQRKVLTPAFATGYIRDIVPIFTDKSADLVNTLLHEVSNQGPEGIEMLRYLSRTTLDIIGSAGVPPLNIVNAGFGYEFNSLHNPDDPFAGAYADIFQTTDASNYLRIAGNYLPWLMKLPFPRLLQVVRAKKVIVQQATKLVRDKEAQPGVGKDILSLMIAENRKAEGQLAEMELVDQCMTFLLAGHETTSTAVFS